MTGFVQGRAWGVATVFGPGQTYIAGEGIYNWHGGATCSYAIGTAFCGVGGSSWTGSGQIIHNGIAMMRTATTASSVRASITVCG